MNPLLQLLTRHSTPAKALIDPAPDDEQLKQILKIAMSAPDHGRIQPYRFITIRDGARYELSEVFGKAVSKRDPNASDAYVKKQKDKPLRSPLIVVVVACLTESEKIPQIEQMLSAGAAAHNILLASNAMGFGSIWLTGDNAYDTTVFEALGLAANEKIIGFINLGTEKIKIPRQQEAEPDDKMFEWKSPANDRLK
ncbi:MAG: nitroreductase [Proteobacteria bacterium]|nr:nitroreductase [Pseudomonadota bacterium]